MYPILRFRIIAIFLVLMSMVAINIRGEDGYARVRPDRSSIVGQDTNSFDKVDAVQIEELVPECGTSNCVYFPIIVKSGIDTFSVIGTVLEAGPNGSWDDDAVIGPEVLHDGTQYLMWYTGVSEETNYYQIGYATSLDGINWMKNPQNPVLTVGDQGSWDEKRVEAPAVLFDGSTWKMWYTGYSDVSGYQLGYATSTDGINWVKYANNPIFIEDPDIPSVTSNATAPHVMLKQGTYHMWYSQGLRGAIEFANSLDGINWTIHPNSPVLEPFPGGEYCGLNYLFSPTIVQLIGDYHMWVTAIKNCKGTGDEYWLYSATSRDGISWVLGNRTLGFPDGLFSSSPTAISNNHKVKMWYVNSGKLWHAEADIIP